MLHSNKLVVHTERPMNQEDMRTCRLFFHCSVFMSPNHREINKSL